MRRSKRKWYNSAGKLPEGKKMKEGKKKQTRKLVPALLALIAGFGTAISATSAYAIWYFNTNQTVSQSASVDVKVAVNVDNLTFSFSGLKIVMESADEIYWADSTGTAIASNIFYGTVTGTGFSSLPMYGGYPCIGVAASFDVPAEIRNYVNFGSYYFGSYCIAGTYWQENVSDTSVKCGGHLPMISYTTNKPTNITEYNTMVSALSGKTISAVFAGGSGVSLTIPSAMTSLDISSFFYVKALSVPTSITNIENGGLSDCYSLETINYAGTKAQWAAITKGTAWHTNVPSTTVVTCTDGTVALS
jgi:hypothetical protein